MPRRLIGLIVPASGESTLIVPKIELKLRAPTHVDRRGAAAGIEQLSLASASFTSASEPKPICLSRPPTTL